MGRTTFGIGRGTRRALAGGAGAVVLCCAPGCFGAGAGREPASLTSNNPGARIPAIKQTADRCDPRDTETALQLVKSLESDDPAVRFYAIRGLQNLTGETFGFVWYADDDAERRASVDRWKQWIGVGGGVAPEPGKVAGGNGDATD
jgi:hypothetical protein